AVGFAFVRDRDLHESARMETSTDTEPAAATSGEGGDGSEGIAVAAARVAVQGQEPAGGSY
ncbi:MFS transporter, partial [Streptomyces canus]